MLPYKAPTRKQGVGQEPTLHDVSFLGLERVRVEETLDRKGDRERVAATSAPWACQPGPETERAAASLSSKPTCQSFAWYWAKDKPESTHKRLLKDLPCAFSSLCPGMVTKGLDQFPHSDSKVMILQMQRKKLFFAASDIVNGAMNLQCQLPC